MAGAPPPPPLAVPATDAFTNPLVGASASLSPSDTVTDTAPLGGSLGGTNAASLPVNFTGLGSLAGCYSNPMAMWGYYPTMAGVYGGYNYSGLAGAAAAAAAMAALAVPT